MKILGLNHDMWISSAALIIDGKIVAACPEERLTRSKMTRVFPKKAMDFCLTKAGIKLDQVDYIANSYNPAVHLKKFNPIFSNHRRFRGDYYYSIPDFLLNDDRRNKEDSDYSFQKIKLGKKQLNIYYITHHLCHAANGFYISPFKRSSILTADGAGEDDTVNFLTGDKNEIKLLKRLKVPHSIGSFYSTFTDFFGYKVDSDEWKVMALSAFGSKNNKYYQIIKKIINLKPDGSFELNQSYFKQFNYILPNTYTENFVSIFGDPKKRHDNFKKKDYEIASAMQQVFEDICSHMLKYLYKKTKNKNLVLSGGSFMNSVFNGKANKISPFRNVWLSSCPDDSGQSIGAALYLYNNILKKKNRYELKHNYFGPSYTSAEIKNDLIKYKVKFKHESDIAKKISGELANGKIVGWFQNKMEFGQRALGNRSILADPRRADAKNRVNNAVKYRENFRPFAPAVIDKYACEYFVMAKGEKVPFMEKVVMVKKNKRKIIPAVVHKDFSARVQTVDSQTNKIFYNLINEFYNKTGVPVLLNTSFNLNGEPIVCSPTDAIRTFYSCGLDILVIGSYIIYK
jgi:carbamoyltransferase